MKKNVIVLGLLLLLATLQGSAQAEFLLDKGQHQKAPKFHVKKIKSGKFTGILHQNAETADYAVNQDPICKDWLKKLSAKQLNGDFSLRVNGMRGTLTYKVSGEVSMEGTIKGRIGKPLKNIASFAIDSRKPLVGAKSVDLLTLVQQDDGSMSVSLDISEDINNSTTGAPFCETSYQSQ